MSFQQGLSGLNAAAKNLDVIGNNVANSNTTGFKQSVATFGDVFAASLGGGDATQVGIGSNLSSVSQQFSQGNITTTNNPLDIAINGKGFFRLSEAGAISYARNGQFSIDKGGYIVASTGANMTGFLADTNGNIVPGVLASLQLPTTDQTPKPTQNITVGANLSASDAIKDPALFISTKPETFNFSTATSVIDSLGKSHTATMFFNKTSVDPATQNSTWTTSLYVDSASADAGAPSVITFDSGGKPILVDGLAITPANDPIKTVTALALNNGAAPLALKMDFARMTQYGSSYSVNALDQDGYTSGGLSGFSIGVDGTIIGRYNNGQTQTLGQVALANFSNAQGLKPMGESRWTETVSSGAALVGAPGTASLGSLQSAAREDSNVDLTAELVNMITAQRIYQANAQSIKTQDAVLQTLVNLK